MMLRCERTPLRWPPFDLAVPNDTTRLARYLNKFGPAAWNNGGGTEFGPDVNLARSFPAESGVALPSE